MIVNRNKLSRLERMYFPAIFGGFLVTARHFRRTCVSALTKFFTLVFKGKEEANKLKFAETMEYPETKPVMPEGYRGAPYLVKDQEDRTKCVSCQLCEFVCPPKAIKITPPGPEVNPDTGNVEKRPENFEINMLRCIFCGFCQEVCPEEAIFLQQDYSLTGQSRGEMVYDIRKLLELGGTHNDTIKKWEHKAKVAEAQGVGH